MSSLASDYPEVVQALTSGDFRSAGKGIVFRCPFTERHKNGDRNPSCTLFEGKGGSLLVHCYGCGAKFEEFKQKAGLGSIYWFPVGKRTPGTAQKRSRVLARYVYRYPDGREHGTKLRLEGKLFLWERPVPEDIRLLCGIPSGERAVISGSGSMGQGWFLPKPAKKGGYWFGPSKPDVPGAVLIPAAGDCPLYLSESLGKDETVLVCEGEKDTHTARSLGQIATCGPCGSSQWLESHSRQLAGRSVVIVPDNDKPGLQFVEKAVGSLICHGVREIRILYPSVRGWELEANGDLTKWSERYEDQKQAGVKLATILARLPRWHI